MPEGHTIHRLARDHQRWFRGERVAVSSPQGRFDGASALDGGTFERGEAYGKHLFHHFESGLIAHVHLGLFGRFFTHDAPPPPPRDTCRMRVASGGRAVDLVGATICEVVDEDGRAAIVARLGPDPLRRDADPGRAFAALQRRSVGIGQALMDQKVLAGVGNVYRAEVLFVHGIHPDRPANAITKGEWDGMWETLVAWMRDGVRTKRIVTVDREEVGIPTGRIPKRLSRYVYKQEHCLRCGDEVRRWDIAGRWAYACEGCQVI